MNDVLQKTAPVLRVIVVLLSFDVRLLEMQ